MMKKGLSLWLFLCFLFCTVGIYAQTNYKITSGNLVKNSTFNGDANGVDVPDWTFSPSGDASLGWKKENVLIYGEYLFVDRFGTNTATPSLNDAPCVSTPKVVKFYYNEANTGPYTFNVKLGDKVIASFSQNGLAAQSNVTIGTGVTAIIDRKFISEGTWTNSFIWNNIWHEVEIYIPDYTNGDLVFESIRTGGISRQIRLDNVGFYEALETPIPTETSIATASCDITTANLDTVLPTAKEGIVYTWYRDANRTTKVDNPTQASLGTYYLFAEANCGTNAYSYPSTSVTVTTPDGCCGANLIKNGDFSTFTTSGTNGGNILSGTSKLATAIPWNFDPSLFSGITIGSYLNGNTVLVMDPNPSTLATISQPTKACPNGILNLSMNFGMKRNAADLQVRDVHIELGRIRLFTLRAYSKSFFVGGGIEITIININPAVSNLTVNGTAYTSSDRKLDQDQLHLLTAKINYPSTETTNPSFSILVNEGAVPFFDNISLSVAPPDAPTLTSTSIAADCITGVANLTTLQPTTAGFTYEWHTENSITSPLVANPTNAAPGTYYLFAVSTCSGCASTTSTTVTVTSGTCPTVNGKIFADYDGPTTNGISNPTNLGQSTGLYALLVNTSGVVVNSARVNSDGTYSVKGTATGSNFYIRLNNANVAVGTTAPTNTTLNPNYIITGQSNGGTTSNGNITGRSDSFPLTTVNTTQNNINFGIQSPPISSDALGEACELAPNTSYNPMPILYGVDDDPDFNNGIGQKVIIKTVQVVNGQLTYNGTPVTDNFTIDAYNKDLFAFQSLSAGASSFQFTYTFVDAANTESLEAGIVKYSFSSPTISGVNNTTVGTNVTLVGSSPSVSTSWASSDETVATINPTTGEITPIKQGTTTITYTNGYSCSTTITFNVHNASCTKPAIIDNGNTYPSKVGITSLGRAGNTDAGDNWPMVRQSAQLVLESKTKGFVINRVSAEQISTITAIQGMLVYDTTNNCLKIYDGTSWKCLTIATCPD